MALKRTPERASSPRTARIVAFIVTKDPSRKLAQVLRETLRRVELSADISPDDYALLELKRILLLKIASLEATPPPPETGPVQTRQPVRAA